MENIEYSDEAVIRPRWLNMPLAAWLVDEAIVLEIRRQPVAEDQMNADQPETQTLRAMSKFN